MQLPKYKCEINQKKGLVFVRGGINLVLVAPLAGDIIHETSISHPPPPLHPPPGMRNITPSQERAFTLQLHRPWQNRVVIMWNYWYKQTDEWPVRQHVCVCVYISPPMYSLDACERLCPAVGVRAQTRIGEQVPARRGADWGAFSAFKSEAE